jgi:hypothetical protein
MRKPSNKNVPISFVVSGIDQTILLLKLSPPLAQCNILTGLATLANRQVGHTHRQHFHHVLRKQSTITLLRFVALQLLVSQLFAT